MKDPRDVIVQPLITEASMDALADGKYTFVVDRKATKTEIKQAVQIIFKVAVVKVNTMNYQGKLRRMGRFIGRRPGWKKAIVTLAEGQQIKQFFEEIVS